MLYLETSGSRYSKKLCEDVVIWFIANYLPRHKLDITINHRGLLREGVFGWCTVMDCDYRPREFEIELHNRMDKDQYVRILFHELWHVYQHVKGHLKDKGEKRYWRGIDHTLTDYKDQPWEMQAREMESVLYNIYLPEVPRVFTNRLTNY